MSQVQRERALSDFNSRAECRVMVISLKAGGVGLNLTAASIVFLLDPWWYAPCVSRATGQAGLGL
jgi:SNF2 family DNA or RNA helicase